jgi:hypothetical protein
MRWNLGTAGKICNKNSDLLHVKKTAGMISHSGFALPSPIRWEGVRRMGDGYVGRGNGRIGRSSACRMIGDKSFRPGRTEDRFLKNPEKSGLQFNFLGTLLRDLVKSVTDLTFSLMEKPFSVTEVPFCADTWLSSSRK